ncbi:zinc finger protein 184-like isoform X2 [Watersipora subatra]|uniref:zinc finger protein 184-like isoform X2 n=1 Tax=Watersipora subatra TaxID=2589382 RepID=UPI00355BB6EC
MSCIFCDNAFADPVLPHNRQKICVLFDVSFNGKKLLHDGKICSKCHVQVDLIDNAMKLKTEMSQCLQDKLGGDERLPSSAGHNGSNLSRAVSPPPLTLPPNIEHMQPPQLTKNGIQQSSSLVPPMLPRPPLPPGSAAEIMAMASLQSSLVALASSPMMGMPSMTSLSGMPTPPSLTHVVSPATALQPENKGGAYMCVHCGRAFQEHQELLAHDPICSSNAGNDTSPAACDRCGQSLRQQSPEDRVKHIIQCKGQGMRRGRPSTGIINCPKCGLKLKNRMNHDRINHVQRCNGSGLKRGRPSLKSVERFQCEKCHRNLWSRDQLELHAAKCDGSHVERRGRKPGDNCCMVCGENLIYRHILKKHLRQVHNINPQNLDDSVIAAVKSEHPADDLNTPYKKTLLGQIQQHLISPAPAPPTQPTSSQQEFSENTKLNQSFDSALGHRKKAIPCKYVEMGKESHSCDRCERVFDKQESFDQHVCCQESAREEAVEVESVETMSTDDAFSSDKCQGSFENRQQLEEQESVGMADMDSSEEKLSAPEPLENVEGEFPALNGIGEDPVEQMKRPGMFGVSSERSENVGSASIKGLAIAKVISGLLDANKHVSNDNDSAGSALPVHRQSIST